MAFLWTKAGMKELVLTTGMSNFIIASSLGLDTSGLPFDWNRVIGDMVPPTVAGYAAHDFAADSPLGPFDDPVKQNVYMKFPGLQFDNTDSVGVDVTAAYLFKTASPHDLWGMWVPDGALNFAPDSIIILNALFGEGQPGQEFTSEVDIGV